MRVVAEIINFSQNFSFVDVSSWWNQWYLHQVNYVLFLDTFFRCCYVRANSGNRQPNNDYFSIWIALSHCEGIENSDCDPLQHNHTTHGEFVNLGNTCETTCKHTPVHTKRLVPVYAKNILLKLSVRAYTQSGNTAEAILALENPVKSCKIKNP